MSEPILEMRNITKTFPGVKALQDVDLRVQPGEIHAICGENGAGKSTLMKVLSGVYPHGNYDGEIVFDGRPMSFGSINDSEAEGIVIIHQRSEEHTSELQSRFDLVCRLLLEKKKVDAHGR